MTMSDLDRVLAHIDADLDRALDRLFAILRMRSISTDPAYASECRACADWLATDLASIGFAAKVRETAGHPVVVGHLRDGGRFEEMAAMAVADPTAGGNPRRLERDDALELYRRAYDGRLG